MPLEREKKEKKKKNLKQTAQIFVIKPDEKKIFCAEKSFYFVKFGSNIEIYHFKANS